MATTSKRKSTKSSLDTVKRFKPLDFNILDDHHDPHEHFNGDLIRYFTSPTILPITSYAQEAVAVEINVDDSGDDDHDDEDMNNDEQQQLSQKMNDLSVESTNKKMKVTDKSETYDINYDRIVDLEELGEEVPTYLMADNSTFTYRINKVLEKQASSISIDDLRQMAIIKHHGSAYERQKRLLLVYLRSVKGTLKDTWSESLAIDRHYIAQDVRLMAKEEKKNEDYRFYETLLQQRIQQIDDKLAQYNKELQALMKKCPQMASSIEETMDEIIKNEGIQYIEMKYDAQIALATCDYDGAILERRYEAEKPNQVQLDTANRLFALRFDAEKARRILMEWKQSVFQQRVPKELHTEMLSMIHTMDVNTSSSTTSNRYEQLVRQRMTQYMIECITEAETNFDRCRRRLDAEIEKVWKLYHDREDHLSMPQALIDIIDKRFINISDRLRIIYNYRMNSPIHTSSELKGFGPCLYLQTTHTFNKKQLALLNRGPTYVIPCQLLSVSPSPSSKSEMLKELYGPLKQQLTRLFAKHHVNIALSMDLHNKLRQKFDEHFSLTIPDDLCQRSSDETRVMSSIRRLFIAQGISKLMLRRTADNKNTFYYGNVKEFNEKASEFIGKTDLYEFQLSIDEKRYGMEWQNDIHGMIESINYMLRRIHEKKGINDDLLKRLTIDPSTIKLPYLYFLPQMNHHDQTLSVMPIIVAYESPTWLLGRFLDRLLRPVLHRSMQRTEVDDENDFALKLHHFYRTGRAWSSKTLLATIHIKNYDCMVPHTIMAEILEYFLQDNLPGNSIEKISIINLKNLVHLFLFNNVFVYDEKIYKCMKGSPTTMPLTETLANIYMFQWQKMLVKQLQAQQQFFARHERDIFFTWNGSENDLRQLVERLHTYDTNLQLDISIGSAVHYMNAYIENRSGQLFSRVDHSKDYQQYTLPYVYHHAIEDHSDWLRFALVRAACYSTLVTDFIRERLYIELTYLTNGYTLFYVEQRVDHFFNYFNMITMRYSSDQKLYEQFRSKVFAFVEQRQDLVHKLYQDEDDRKLFHFHYAYEYGPRSKFDETFHRLWLQYFKHDRILSAEKAMIMLTTKHQYSLNVFLGQPNVCFRTLTVKKP